MATLSEHVIAIRAAIKAAKDDGLRFSLEDGADYDVAYVDLEEYGEDGQLVDWAAIIDSFN